MRKKIPFRQQITRAVQNNPRVDCSFLVSGCFCNHINEDDLKDCEKCGIKFYCYTNARIKRVPVAE